MQLNISPLVSAAPDGATPMVGSAEPENLHEQRDSSARVSMLTPALQSRGEGIDSGVRPMAPSGAAPARTGPPRLPQELHKCNLGEVVELGPRGARIRSGKHLKGVVTLQLVTADRERIDIESEVVSSSKKGGRQYDSMLEFQNVDAHTHREILEIAMAYRPLTMRPLSGD